MLDVRPPQASCRPAAKGDINHVTSKSRVRTSDNTDKRSVQSDWCNQSVSATVVDQTDAAGLSNVINREQLFAHNTACCIAENI